MEDSKLIVFVVLIVTCVDFILAELDLSLGNQDGNTGLEHAGNFTESYTGLANADNFTVYDEQGRHTRAGTPKAACTAGRRPDPADCSKYYWCVEDPLGTFTEYHEDCPGNLVYNPHACTCTSASVYTCVATTSTANPITTPQQPTVCTAVGFICPTTTTFTFCLGPNAPFLPDSICPPSYYCNTKCKSPCVSSIPDC